MSNKSTDTLERSEPIATFELHEVVCILHNVESEDVLEKIPPMRRVPRGDMPTIDVVNPEQIAQDDTWPRRICHRQDEMSTRTRQ